MTSSQRLETSLSFNSVTTTGSSSTLVIRTPDTIITPGGTSEEGVRSREGVLSTQLPTPEHEDLEERNSHHLQSEERATRFVVSPSQLLDHVTENDYGKQPSEVSVTTVPEKKLGADKRVGKSDQHDENFQNPENIQSDRSQPITANLTSESSQDTKHWSDQSAASKVFDMEQLLADMDKLEQDGEDGEGEDAEEDDVTKPDKTEDYEVTPPDTPEIPVPVGIEIPADLRSRSPNIANLIQKRRPSLATSNKSPVASFTPTPVDRLTTANTSVGVFINGKLSGHSEQRSILTSHYLAINSLGVLSYFHYRLRATELPDCVAALSNGEIIIADNHSDIRRLKFFDGNQRYQRSLPLVPDFKEFESPPYVTDIQLSNQDTRLWICDCFNQTIREIDIASGHTYQLWQNDRLERGHKLIRPGKIAITPERVYVCDAGDQSVKAFQRNSGDYLFQFKIGLKESEDDTFSQFHQASRSYGSVLDDYCGCPWSIHWTMDETLLVGDIRYDFVYIVDKRGKQLGKFGGNGKGPNKFNGPVSICSDGDGNIAIADAKNGRVQIFTRDMMSITQLYPVDDCEEVSSLALTSDGMLTVIDHLNNLCLIF